MSEILGRPTAVPLQHTVISIYYYIHWDHNILQEKNWQTNLKAWTVHYLQSCSWKEEWGRIDLNASFSFSLIGTLQVPSSSLISWLPGYYFLSGGAAWTRLKNNILEASVSSVQNHLHWTFSAVTVSFRLCIQKWKYIIPFSLCNLKREIYNSLQRNISHIKEFIIYI